MTQLGGPNPFLSDGITTASPQRLLVMLYDRLLLDFDRAELAIKRGDHDAAHSALVHAQDIVAELDGSLDTSVWAAGEHLSAVYGFVTDLLVDANVKKDITTIGTCRDLMSPLRDAWREAAGLGASAA